MNTPLMSLPALAASWEAQAAAVEAQPARSKAAKASRAHTAALLREKAVELRAVADPQGRKSKVHTTLAVPLHYKYLRRAAEYGISPTYLARKLCDEFAAADPASALTVRLIDKTRGVEQIVEFKRTVDDSKLVLDATAPATPLTGHLNEQKGGR